VAEVGEPCPVPVGLRCVVAVIAGQVQAEQVQQRVLPVQFQLPERDPRPVLERGQMRLVVRILKGLAGSGGRCQRGQGRAHPGGREILDQAVVLVPSGVLALLGDVQVTYRPQAG